MRRAADTDTADTDTADTAAIEPAAQARQEHHFARRAIARASN
jgi:hypothetical protein